MSAAVLPLPPPTPYDRTSQRPAWESLPSSLRGALENRIGSPVISAHVNGTGFTAGFAALLTVRSGNRLFVKAAELSLPTAEWYRREAEVASALPLRVRAARLQWSGEVAGFFVACSDAIPGARVPDLPWHPAELRAALEALAVSFEALSAAPPVLPLAAWDSILDGTLDKWRTSPPPHPFASELARLEAGFDEFTRGTTQLAHCDLRLDNVVIDAVGKAWLCDWGGLCYGPAWFDTVSLLLSAEASGIDPDPLFWSHPTSAGVPPYALDGALAAFLGYYLDAAAQPDVPTSPNIRPHQRYYAQLTSRWLSRRLPTFPVDHVPRESLSTID